MRYFFRPSVNFFVFWMKWLVYMYTKGFWIILASYEQIGSKVVWGKCASGNTTQFKIKTATALKKLMSTYCERNGLDVQVTIWLTWSIRNALLIIVLSFTNWCATHHQSSLHQSIRFTFDGQRVTGGDTAASLGLEEGDTIEVFQVTALALHLLHWFLFNTLLQEQQGGATSTRG